MTDEKTYHLLNNSRFYILVSSVLLSIATASYLRLEIPSDQLFYIRLQQLFGLFCIFYWYIALIIAPIGHIIGKHRTKKLAFARRAIGVSAFYFALLHTVIAFFGQLGGFTKLAYLPDLFKWSLPAGLIALIILFLLAMTSFDKVIQFMSFRKWKWLHRFIYIGGVLAILHVWTIGTHLAYAGVQLAAFIALVVLAGLELYCTNRLINDKYLHFEKPQMFMMFVSSWAIAVVIIVAIPSYVENYHNRHNHPANSPSVQHRGH